MLKQLSLFSYETEDTGLRDINNYAEGYKWLAKYESGMTLWELKDICLYEIRNSNNDEKRKQWENALKSVEEMIKDWEE